jgi:hypothetical protein
MMAAAPTSAPLLLWLTPALLTLLLGIAAILIGMFFSTS